VTYVADDGTLELPPDFRDCIEALNEHRVRYVLVGGYALGAHGVVRATGDIDFLYDAGPANVERLCAALLAFGAPDRFIDPPFLRSPDAVTQIGVPPHRIDFLSAIIGVTFVEVMAGSERIEMEGLQFRVIGLAELRKNKAASGRAKDRNDLRRLRRPKR
jgi:predicted nucleotidyltransferase